MFSVELDYAFTGDTLDLLLIFHPWTWFGQVGLKLAAATSVLKRHHED
jgi:hypothetical protein